MRKKLFEGIIPALVFAGISFAQTPATGPTFEVVSIKPAPPLDPSKIMAGKFHFGVSIDAQRVDMGSMSLADMIRYAYTIKPYQLTGPDWMSGQRFDVLAKMPDGATKEQVPAMMQAMLAERFKLTIHRDSKEHGIYALVVGKGGPKMKEAAPEVPAPPPPAEDGAPPKPAEKNAFVVRTGDTQMQIRANNDGKGASIAGGPMGKMKMTMGENGMMRMEFGQMTMPGLADALGGFVDKPVMDMTELTGKYEVALEIPMDELKNMARASGMMNMIGAPGAGGNAGGAADSSRPGDAASAPAASSIFTTVQKLGLKLEPRKAPMQTIVVDHLEKAPTEN